MADLGTIRERIQRAVAYFHERDGVVLTTFNLSGSFLEEQALPLVLGVEADATAARRAETHMRLAETPCTVFYDPSVAPGLSGRFRVVARPVPVKGRFFHPKLVVVAGRAQDGRSWVYLAVSSANLSLSGWGRNAEVFGETWIHTRRQQSWDALDKLLEWLQGQAPLGEATGESESDAVSRVRAVLATMTDERILQNDGTSPWSGTLHARLYSSITHPAGLADFMQRGRARRAKELWVLSPYWSDVAEQVACFGARRTILVPARRRDNVSVGLARAQAAELPRRAELRRNRHDTGDRFWHAKAYVIRHGEFTYAVIGSCNFTQAGLAGGAGNVEAALFVDAVLDWLPESEPLDPDELATEVEPEENVPTPTPLLLVVAYDWRSRAWRWWLEAGAGQSDFVLELPGLPAFTTGSGTHERAGAPPKVRAATFTMRYRTLAGAKSWEGQVVELNLDHSDRSYGRPLSADEILASWRGRALAWDIGGGGGYGEPDADDESASPADRAAFAACNLYDLYRSMRALRERLRILDGQPATQRALLVGRPDSLMALAHLVSSEGAAEVVSYLVLREIRGVMQEWSSLVSDDLLAHIDNLTMAARERTRTRLAQQRGDADLDIEGVLDWFEARLAALDGARP